MEATGAQTAILKTLIDISRIITNSHDLRETLEMTVTHVAGSLDVDVCSLYIHDVERGVLELAATHGLEKSAVGQVELSDNEGLIGAVFQGNTHLNLRDVANHPSFKYVPEVNEDQLSSFLGVPLIEFRKTLGVLVVQNQEDRLFTSEEETLLITIASQISGLVSKALLVDQLQNQTVIGGRIVATAENGSFHVQGVPIAPGLALGNVICLTRRRIEEPDANTSLSSEEELAALHEAIEHSEKELLDLLQEMSVRVDSQEAAIFHSHLLFLEDRGFIGKIETLIRQGNSAAWAVSHVVREYLEAFQGIGDPYLKERGADLEDVGYRMLHHLGMDGARRELKNRTGILVAEMLLPSDTAQLDPERIKAIITAAGGHVSHAAILARSLRIPAVSGVENALSVFTDGEQVMVDGDSGMIYVNPDDSVTKEVERHQLSRMEYLSHLDDLRDIPCTTKCGERIILRANIGMAQDLEDCGKFGAEGIGVYRTEVFYLMRDTRPTVQDLVGHFSKAVEVADGGKVVFRTLDLGADSPPSYLRFPAEENPALGTRSIRYQLQHEELLRDQIMAVLHIAHMGDVQMVFPMIGQMSELHAVKRIYADCRAIFEREEGRPAPEVKLGMIFEVPSSILLCDLFIDELDFVTIGANDLTQYVLAVDRNNPHVSHLFDPLEPAVLMMIRKVVETSKAKGRPTELIGELASDPDGCLVLVGMGLRELSVNAPLIPILKDRLGQFTLAEMEHLANIAAGCTSAAHIRRNLQNYLPGRGA